MRNTVVISGGTATNQIIDAFIPQNKQDSVTFILPVSDNGGSSSEILRVLGGCAIGDIRSRLIRLIPDETKIKGVNGVKELLGYRLNEEENKAREEWDKIVHGNHYIWDKVDLSLRVMIRSFLIHVDMEINKRSLRLKFRFESASVGNLFLTGTRLFFGDLDSGIEFVKRMCRINENINVHGCLNTNFTYHIAAILENGDVIRGQSQISHPSEEIGDENENETEKEKENNGIGIEIDVDTLTHPSLEKSQLRFHKEIDGELIPPLPSKIARVLYISPYGEEIHPRASNKTLRALEESDTVIFSIGSLWTSIVPVLLLRGVGESIIKGKPPKKLIMFLNSTRDRETNNMTWYDNLIVIKQSLSYSMGVPLSLSDVVHVVVYCRDSPLLVQQEESIDRIEKEGIKCIPIPGSFFEHTTLLKTLKEGF
jgi:2-phospho-L-lactate transferase/gluconeogenesis factor (CofD/UPF0052 family)